MDVFKMLQFLITFNHYQARFDKSFLAVYRPFSSCLPSLDQTLDRVTLLLVTLFFSVLATIVHASDADSDGVSDDTAWVQVGADIVGEAERDHSGSSVKLSAVGDAIAIGTLMGDLEPVRSGSTGRTVIQQIGFSAARISMAQRIAGAARPSRYQTTDA